MASGSSPPEPPSMGIPSIDPEHRSRISSPPSSYDTPTDGKAVTVGVADANPGQRPTFSNTPSIMNEHQEIPDFGTPSSIDAEGSDDLDDLNDLDGERDSPMADPESPSENESPDHSSTQSRSSPQNSLHSAKRKIGLEDQYIQQDPELYGLRRSGRAHQNQRIVESNSDDDDSDVDTRPARKRRKGDRSQRPSDRVTPNIRSISRSGSDSDTYGTSRHRAETKKHRRLRVQAEIDMIPPPERFSTRRAAKIQNYNEDDDENEFVEDGSELTPNYWVGGPDDDSPYIEAVLDHRVKQGLVTDPDEFPQKEDFEFCVKWKGRAHYHATWESSSDLSSHRGYRRLENYFKKFITGYFYLKNDPQTTPEDIEQWHLDKERDADAYQEHMQVERIISKRNDEEGVSYLVKWKGLFYESSTWEAASLVSELSQMEIDRYLDRQSNKTVSSKTESNPKTRSPYKPFKDQPGYIKNGTLREFQIIGINFLAHNWCRTNNVILADEMGLGKTVQTISFMSWLRHERQQHGPFLVVVPLGTMPAWADTFNYWAPDTNYVVYHGNRESRDMIRQYEFFADDAHRRAKFHVLLTTYEYVLTDAEHLSKIKWQFVAVDEAHRLKNRDSVLYGRMVDFDSPSRLLITGTPIQNNLSELSALMDFLMPGKIYVEANIDLASEAASQKLAELTAEIAPYMIRRTKKKVMDDLPLKTERILRIELSDIQLEYYKNVLTKNYAALNEGGNGAKASLLNIVMELKKICNHPLLFPPAEERILGANPDRADVLKAMITSSGKMMLLDQLMKKLKKDGHRVLIFSQMVKVLDLLSDYLTARGYQHQRLDGTIGAVRRRMAIDHFNDPESSDFCFLLSTRAGGLGINLMTADTVILFDSDWNPQADLQAMARAHRIGQKKPVTVYRFVSKDTVEEEVLERARNKLMLEYITIQRGVTDKEVKELSDRMVRAGHKVAEPTTADDINRILKKRGQKMFEQSGNQKKLEELDIDAVLQNAEEHDTDEPEGLSADGGEEFLKSFQYTDVKMEPEWDEIIPKEQLERLKAEDERKRHEAFLKEQVEMNAPRKRKVPNDEREERAAKKRARDLTADGGEEDSSDNNVDPKRPMTEKEIRNLIRAYERYGSLEDRGEELIRDAKLVGRDPDIIKATLNEVLDISHRELKQEHERLEALEKNEQKIITKKDRKAVLFDFKGVKRLNAETLIERPSEMRMLKEFVDKQTDYRNFRVDGAEKKVSYTCEWGAREDGMLCVGIARHGFGAWVAIRDDPDLGLMDKFYLEEHRVDNKEKRIKADDKNVKSPGAVHLVRRANYLITCLKDKTSNGMNVVAKKALENHHRNNKKYTGSVRRPEKTTHRASPSPSTGRKMHSTSREPDSVRVNGHRAYGESRIHSDILSRKDVSRTERNGVQETRSNYAERSGKSHQDHQSREKHRHPKAGSPETNVRKHSSGESAKDTSNGQSTVDEKIKNFFNPAAQSLKSLKASFKLTDPHERLAVMKSAMTEILAFLRHNLPTTEPPEFETACWNYIGLSMNRKTIPSPEKLKDLFNRHAQQSQRESQPNADYLPTVQVSGLSTGPAPTPGAAAITNGVTVPTSIATDSSKI